MAAAAPLCLTTPTESQFRPASVPATAPAVQHILFIGDSYTHGRYLPVRHYNNGGVTGSSIASVKVVDENDGQQQPPRQESASEYGPDGGIPGIFSELAFEAGLPYDVHTETDSATNLQGQLLRGTRRVSIIPASMAAI